MPALKDETGNVYGRLTVIARAERPEGLKNTNAYWRCRCECGREVVVNGGDLRRGNTSSCGCYQKDRTSETKSKSEVPLYGLCAQFPKEYTVWYRMVDRTTNPGNGDFATYGLEGIRCCPRWRRSFKNFLEDMGPRPKGGLGEIHLDRTDGDGPYAPWNCKWVSQRENMLNRTSTVWLQDPLDGEFLCQKDMARKFGLKPVTLQARLNRLGWPLEKALMTPVDKRMATKHKSEPQAKEAKLPKPQEAMPPQPKILQPSL
ncbi:hypothetical protein B2D07_18935 [Desulfococcus multivorans]|uniref:Uncharacterized protein n=1 Tax=Desulfococcus multivorans DSM 2059 TaxID=1121405 RepID=S7V545_DESML|nr:conserved uncharacterized protein [Desulfococcus multivorans]AQV02647.1 hypothetical protein B2D07_18935 [Desulfococcus multivorans]EPR39743.1 hypothetical protein dsmv_2591 [Desulfococcus multivorans DSM 2059]SKA05140.1 hypothetical protein SAMN02745446_02578 [Desulfococcus multivorans DSM 2059]